MKLADWRTSKGWTQQELADELGCHFASIWRWEAGKRVPEIDILEKLFVMSEGAVQPNDFYDLPRWRRVMAAAIDTLRRAAA